VPAGLVGRLRRLAPEVTAFAVIGAVNSMLYLALVWVLMPVGAVKANVAAAVVTTVLAYLANRHWTYRRRPSTGMRRELVLFLLFNMAGMVIQSGSAAAAKYGLGLSEDRHAVWLLVATAFGMGVATVFRFWTYRTFVFADGNR
jgi:putative flippase GtrA